ncbi:hypothetical protein [Ferrovibrio sp.]|uniref:hypothetical protein n=1 Tax=Ferrovibrio sp. TaxID=1917215 RepID=UPI00311D8ED6
MAFIVFGEAQAQTGDGMNIRRADFYDFEFVRNIWTNERSLAQYNALDQKYCRPEYKELRRPFSLPGMNRRAAEIHKAKEVVEAHPQSQQIKKCIDVDLIYYKWFWLAQTEFNAIIHHRSAFNELDERSKTCIFLKGENFFTGQCNDLPDWRTQKAIESEKRALSIYTKRSAGK